MKRNYTKEDIKRVLLIILFLLYSTFGIEVLMATVKGTGEYGMSFFFNGLTMSVLLLIPVGYIIWYSYKHDLF
jgi:hypothetical protein